MEAPGCIAKGLPGVAGQGTKITGRTCNSKQLCYSYGVLKHLRGDN